MVTLAENEVERLMDRASRVRTCLASVKSNNDFDRLRKPLVPVTRFSIADGLANKAAPISPRLKPHKALRMSASCASTETNGSQQEKINTRRSSRGQSPRTSATHALLGSTARASRTP